MANTEWWQRGPIEGVPAVLQPVAHILLQVRESVGEMVGGLFVGNYASGSGMMAGATFGRIAGTNAASAALQS